MLKRVTILRMYFVFFNVSDFSVLKFLLLDKYEMAYLVYYFKSARSILSQICSIEKIW